MLLCQRTSDEPISECCEKSREKVPDTVWTQSMKERTKGTEQNISMKRAQVDWPYGMSENRCHKVSASALPCWQKESESKTRCISVINTVGLNTACRVCTWRRCGHGEECTGLLSWGVYSKLWKIKTWFLWKLKWIKIKEKKYESMSCRIIRRTSYTFIYVKTFLEKQR